MISASDASNAGAAIMTAAGYGELMFVAKLPSPRSPKTDDLLMERCPGHGPWIK